MCRSVKNITAVASASWSRCELGYVDGMLQVLQQELLHNAVAAEYPQCTLKATPPCSSDSNNVLLETVRGVWMCI